MALQEAATGIQDTETGEEEEATAMAAAAEIVAMMIATGNKRVWRVCLCGCGCGCMQQDEDKYGVV